LQNGEEIPQSMSEIINSLESPTKRKIFGLDEGMQIAFERTPELSKIGNKEDYSLYLKSIFPKGEIYYHSTVVPFEEFKQERTTMASKDMDEGLYVSDLYHSKM
jgi:hypothetical protein